MIHTLLNLKRPLFVIDCETTGLSKDAHIIELGFQQWGPNTVTCNCEYAMSSAHAAGCPNPNGSPGGMIKEWRSLIDPGIPIPAEIIELTGITDFKIKCCQACGGVREGMNGSRCECEHYKIAPKFAQLAPSLSRGFVNCDYAGKNVRFDLEKLSEEFARCNVSWSYADARIIDIDRLEAIAYPRHLASLHKKYLGEEHEGAHGALSDVRASTAVIIKQLEAHDCLPRDLDELHKLSWPGWLVSDGSFRIENAVPKIMFGKHRGKSLREIPQSYWDFILTNDFPPDVKKLASAAKLGNYPC